MKKKKTLNEARMRVRKDGRYEARYTVGVDSNGKQRQKSVYGKTPEEVEKKLQSIQNQIYTKTYIDNDTVRLGEWIQDWMRIYKKNSVRASTYECMMMYIRKHILKHDISCMKLIQLKPLHFQSFYGDKINVMAPASIRKIHNIFKSCMNQAVKNELIIKNPVTFSEPPTLVKTEIEILTIEEQEIFIQALEGHALKPFFLLALQSGMRIGEIIALKWSWINLKENTLIVKGSAKRVITEFEKDFPGIKSKIISQDPKTKNSTRTIPLMLSAVTMLKRIKKAEQIKCMKAGERWSESQNVFRTENNTMYDAKNINRTLHRILDKAGIKKITFHSLRHTFVSRMLEAGEDIKTISEIIGHSKTSFTMDVYAHILPNKKHQAIEKISHFFSL